MFNNISLVALKLGDAKQVRGGLHDQASYHLGLLWAVQECRGVVQQSGCSRQRSISHDAALGVY